MNAMAVEAVEETTSWFGDAVENARQLLARHDHFRDRMNSIEMCECDGVLLVRGQVPSFYLKQLLQRALASAAGVWRIENRVDVVSPDGLSSVRWR